jgi:hypothetical protein
MIFKFYYQDGCCSLASPMREQACRVGSPIALKVPAFVLTALVLGGLWYPLLQFQMRRIIPVRRRWTICIPACDILRRWPPSTARASVHRDAVVLEAQAAPTALKLRLCLPQINASWLGLSRAAMAATAATMVGRKRRIIDQIYRSRRRPLPHPGAVGRGSHRGLERSKYGVSDASLARSVV